MNRETFEDRLLAQLTEMDAARPAADIPPARRSLTRRPIVLAAAAVATVLAAGAIGFGSLVSRSGNETVAVPPPGGSVAVKPASFTVVNNADGTVTFTVNDLLDLGGATKALNDAGIVGRVLTSTADCTTGPNAIPIDPDDLYPADTFHRLGKRGGGVVEGDTVTVSSSFYPPGGGLMVTVGGGYLKFDNNRLHLFIGYFAYVDANKIPQCVNFVDPGTGDVGPWPPVPRVR